MLFYLMYADFEENFGMHSHVLRIYDRALREIQEATLRARVLNLALAKTAKF